jgi:hypothetical protein
MATQIKITQLTDIGSANLSVTTLLPVVNMAGVPTTQKTTLGNLANVILSQSGGNYAAVGTANIAYSVANAAQPNITSVGTLTNVVVSGNATVNGNITSNGTAYVGNLSTTGLASITTLSVGATANLGAVGNITITGGTVGQVLSTDGNGVLSWASDATTYGNSNVAAYLPTYTGNIGGDVVTANLFSGNGQALTNIAGANVSGFVPNANVANTAFAVAAANVSGLGNIATLNLDGNASNLLTGNGTYVAIPVVPTVGNIATINLDGNSQTWLAGNGVFANIAIPSVGNIATLNLDGNVSNLLTGNGTYVAIPTVPTVGNIATINLDGNSSNVLRGDGTFAADANSSYGDSNVTSLLGAFGSNTITTTGNITGGNIIGNGSTLSNVAVQTIGSWTLASGVNTVNISVPLNGTYTIWINGNIPNGIVTYTATAVVTNTNVPVLGSQYAWYYETGNALVFTSIPDQFVGTEGSISNASPYAANTANVFTFGITNNSGNAAVVNYGYTKL